MPAVQAGRRAGPSGKRLRRASLYAGWWSTDARSPGLRLNVKSACGPLGWQMGSDHFLSTLNSAIPFPGFFFFLSTLKENVPIQIFMPPLFVDLCISAYSPGKIPKL